jgi:hypothetical protein
VNKVTELTISKREELGSTNWASTPFVCLFPWASAESHGCTAACWLIVPPALNVQTLATRCLRAYRRVPQFSGGSWNLWAGIRTDNFAQMPTSTAHLGFFYMQQIYFPSEGRSAEDFSALKNPHYSVTVHGLSMERRTFISSTFID